MTLEQSSAAASTCSGSTRIKTCQCIDSSRSRRRRRRRPAAAGGRKASTSTCAGRFLLHAYAGAAAVAAASTAQSNEYAAATASAGAYLTEEHLRSIQNFDPRRQAAAAAADRRPRPLVRILRTRYAWQSDKPPCAHWHRRRHCVVWVCAAGQSISIFGVSARRYDIVARVFTPAIRVSGKEKWKFPRVPCATLRVSQNQETTS